MHGDNAFYEKYAGYQSQKLIMVYFFLEHVIWPWLPIWNDR